MTSAKTILPLSELSKELPTLKTQYQNAEIFPHIVLDDFLLDTKAKEILHAFPDRESSEWTNYLHYNEKKYAIGKLDDLPDVVSDVFNALNSQEMLHFLEELTGIKNLKSDPTLEGGGLHQIPCGGFLNIHADYTAHPHNRNWRRRVNVLVYLNEDWLESYGGKLELWTRDMKSCFKKVLPIFNRCVIFSTDEDSYHGHPDPLTCPEDRCRRSIALYYFTEEDKPLKRATNYQARPNEPIIKKALVFADKKLLALYNVIKGALNLNDDFASKLLKWFSRK